MPCRSKNRQIFALLVAADNLIHYDTNYAFVSHVLSMDTTFPGNALLYRRITSPILWQAGYALIIAGEGLTGARSRLRQFLWPVSFARTAPASMARTICLCRRHAWVSGVVLRLYGGFELGLAPLVIVVLVLGVAAILATAAISSTGTRFEVEGRNFRTTSILSSTLELARKQLEQTGKIDPAINDVFRELAGTEAKESDGNWKLWAIGGGLLVTAAAGAWAWVSWGGPATAAVRAIKGAGYRRNGTSR